MLGAAISLGVTSCGSDVDNEASISTGGTVISPNEEKVFVENVLKEFAAKIDANEFNELTSLNKELNAIDIDMTTLEVLFDSFVSSTTTTRAMTYEDVTKVIMLSNLSGTYEASYQSPKWVKTSEGSKGQTYMVYTDKNGARWEVTLSASGSNGKIFLNSDIQWNHVSSTYNGTYKEANYKVVYTDTYLDVPQNINGTIKKNGNTLVSENITISKFSQSGEDPTLNCECEFSANIKVLSYEVSTSNSYAVGANSGYNFVVSKNGQTLIKSKTEGKITTSGEDVKGGEVNIDVFILDKLQIKGCVPSIKSILDAVNVEYDKNDNKSVRNYVNNMNALFSCKLYNSGAEQCSLILDVDNDTYYGSTRSYYKPATALKFGDGSIYTFEEYISFNDFSGIFKISNSLVSDFSNLTK